MSLQAVFLNEIDGCSVCCSARRFLPACPPSGDGCTFPYMVLCQEDVKAFNGARGVYHASFWKRQMRQATKRDLAVSEMSESDDQRRSLAGSMGVVKQKNPVPALGP